MNIDHGNFLNNLKPSLGRMFALVLLLGMALAQTPIQNVQAQAGAPQLILTKSVEDDLTEVQVGDVIRYRIRFECSSLTTACGQMEITDVLQNGLIYLPPPNSSVPAGFEINYNGGTRTITIIKTDNNLLDGTQYDAVIAVRVDNNFRPLPATINNTINGQIDPPGPVGWQNATPASAPPIAIGAVSASWQLSKTRVAPVIEPTVNTDVTYRLRLCPVPPPSGGIADLTDIVITDTLPGGAVFVSASDGGTYSGGVVSWPAITGPLSPPTCAERYVVIRYPSPPFNVGDSLTNSANVTADYVDSSGNPCPDCFGPPTTNLTHEIDPIADVPTYSKNDSGDPVGITGTARFILNLNTNATNWPANNVTLIDNLPGELQVTSVMSGTWDSSFDYVRAYVEYSTDGGDSWTAFPGQPVSYNTNATYAAPATNITNVRWRFEYDPDGDTVYTPGLPYVWQFTSNPEIRVVPRAADSTDDDGDPLPAAVSGNTYDNCVQVTRTNAGGDVTDPCDIETMTVRGDYVSLRVSKSETPGTPWNDLEDPNINTFTSDATILPGDTLRYILTVDMTERSSAPLVDPTIRDTLPDDLIFVRFGGVRLNGGALPGGATVTTTRSGPNPGAGQTLRWDFSGLTVNETPLGSNVLTVEFFARIPRGQLPGTRANDLYVVTDSDDVYCEIGTQVNDASNGNIDGDTANPDNACENTDTYVVERSAALRGEKWIRSVSTLNSVVVDKDTFAPDPTCPNGGNSGMGASTNDFTRYPCISQAYPEGALNPNQYVSPPPGNADLDDFEYQLRVFNDGNVPMLNYFLYDILPYYGDRGSGGTLANSSRESEFRPVMTGPIQFLGGAGLVAGDFTIQYNLTTNPCRPEVFNTTGTVPAGCDNNWYLAAAISDWSTVRSYRIRLNSGETIAPYVEGDPTNMLRFGLPMSIPKDSPLVGAFNNDDAQSKEIAWNSFSHVGSYQDLSSNIRDLLASEPRKVGITIPEVMSIGNRVWRDSDNSGTINAPDDTNPGIPNVLVHLYTASNTAVPIATTTTDIGGYYLFSNLPAGDYIVGIPASNFNAGGPLNTLRSSTGTPASATYTNPPESNPDQADHGRDPATPGQQVLSATVTLQPATEQAGETDLSNNDRDGIPGARRGVNGERDNNSDLTVDFGFFGGTDVPFSIGNYLWYDNGSGGGTVNDGIRQTVDTGLGTEPPVASARVELYRDGNGNGSADPQEYIRFDVTDANGFYLFDNLDPGTYFVLVAPGNFTNSFDPDGAGTAYSAAPGVLRGWYSSQVTGVENQTSSGQTTTAAIDSDDNGIDTHIPEINGVFSGPIVVTRDIAFPEPSGEVHLSGQPDPGLPTNDDFNPTGWDGPNSRGRFLETDASSNLTVDFGFIPPMSLGNRVWIDSGAGEATFRAGFNNGLMDGTETGVGGVRVELWRDANGNGTLDAGEFIRFTTTDASGYYLFDRIQPGTNYYVHIPASNFATSAPLENYISSYDPNQTTAPADDIEDRDDNGIDNGNNPAANGVTSSPIVMAYTTEPVTETDFSPDTATYGANNVGLFGQANNNSNLTMDFGFVQPPRSIGNYLWFDVGGGAGGVVNDGIRNGTEGPVANARVSLYRDADANGQPDDLGTPGVRTDDWIAWDITDANGYYLFDNLPPANYIVGVDRDNFATGVLVGYTSSTGNMDNASNDLDSRDNGVNRPALTDAILSPHGILSTTINLTASPITLPSGEIGSGNTTTTLGNNPTEGDGANSRGRYGETDTTSDLTIDFGFVNAYSIGNRIWFDTNNNAVMDAGEVGVDGVQVEIYQAAITLPTGPVIDTQVTANSGYYLFDHLPPGNYVVVVTADNFNSTGTYNALVGYWSSFTNRSGAGGAITETAAPDPDANGPDGLPRTADDDIDLDDNGLRRTTGGAPFQNAVLALPVTVGPTGDTEPTDDNDLDVTLPGDQQGQPDARANMKVDFGFYRTEIGNLVYEDVNLNGTYDAGTDTLLNIVRVRLYQQDNNTEVRVGPDGILGTADDTTNGVLTGPNASHPAWGSGEYHFSGLPEGDYIVRVTAGVPAGMISTIDTADQTDNDNPDTNTDNNDNGDGEGPVTVNSDITNRLTTDPGSTGAQSNNTVTQANGTTTDNTVDFGFVNSYSLGNRVWFDTNNNGVLDAAESGITGVRVELYRDTDGNGIYTPGTDVFVGFNNTNATGYYRFDNLFPRDYIVVIPADNFRNVGAGDTVASDPLRSYWSTGTTINGSGVISESATNDPDTNADAYNNVASDENGATTFTGNAINYVASAAVTLGANAEPLLETAPTGQGTVDQRANMTVDFGFYREAIGNLVFSDNDVSGHSNAGDTVISGVLVHLFASNGTTEIITGADGIPGTADDGFGPDGVTGGGDDGTGGMRTNTNATGNYLFSGLPQGNYIVKVDSPAGMVSTIDSNPQADNDNPNTNTDNNDNGDGVAGGTVTSDITNHLTTNPGSTGAQGNNTVTQSTGTTIDPTIDFGFVGMVAIGNRIWIDDGAGTFTNANNGILDAGEVGVNNVTVQLYGLGVDGIAGTPDDNLVGTTSTASIGANAGYYQFDNLFPGQYYVKIPASEFNTGGDLVGYTSTLGNGGVNDDDDQSGASGDENGIDATALAPLTTNGIVTPVYTLLPGTEPTTDEHAGIYTGTLANSNVNFTADFGFFYPFSIGNRIFRDDGAGGGTVNNGIMDGSEAPIANVRVELWQDTNGTAGLQVSGTTPDTFIRYDITDAPVAGVGGGYYLFDGLNFGEYYVHIPAGNFTGTGALVGLYNSTPTGTEGAGVTGNPYTPNTDRDDNGVNNARPDLNGISSGPIVLSSTTEPTGETELSSDTGTASGNNPTAGDGPNSRGRNTETDDDSNLTIDFGFIPSLSLGNRVWVDSGSTLTGPVLSQFNDGLMNGNEPGRGGVALNLYYDANNDGSYTGSETTPYAATVTDADGYYLFDKLPAGRFYVQVAPSNFAAGGALEGYISSAGQSLSEILDVNDNGIDDVNYLTNGIASVNFILNHGNEPINESDLSGNTAAYGVGNVGLYGQTNGDSNLTLDFGFVSPPHSVGNRLWFDDNNNGILDGGELPVTNGVRISLYSDTNNDGQPDDIGAPGNADNWLAWDTTENGYYLFDNLPPGRYLVGVDNTNFQSGNALFEYTSSAGNVDNASNDLDSRDNGVDRTAPGDATASPYGILSTSINLAASSPSGELDLSPDTGIAAGNNPTADDGPNSRGRNGETDANSDLTIDFGFFKPMSIGNRVFLDNGAGNAAFLDNGIMNAGELPIENVRVELYRDTNGTAGLQVGSDTLLRFDITDAGGYYLFDNLTPGEYYIHIPAGNFTTGALQGMNNSTPTGTENGGVAGNPNTPNTDRDDNGVNNTRPDLNGISSGPINLVRDNEPSGETELSGDTGVDAGNDPTTDDGPNSRGRYGEGDNNSNLTVDFGFVPVYSLGNRVWLDTGGTTGVPNNGVMDGDEAGINNVTVRLYRDLNDDGTPDGPSIYTTTTDANGYYRFDNLTAGTYIVEVVPPAGLGSTVDAGQDADDNVDNNDDGVIVLVSDEVRSKPITLGDLPEPTGEEPTPNPDSASGEAPDAQSNRTVDFGFVGAVAIGNVVWFDTGAGYNNGIYEPADENGVDNVTVQLFTAAGVEVPVGPDGVLGTVDDAPGGMLTSGGGYYRFDKLIPGDYYVYIPAAEFQAGGELYTYLSSTDSIPATTSQTDDNNADENGVDGTPANPLTVNGIRTLTYTLTPSAMPVADDDTFYSGTLPDNSVNFTADFGFVEAYSLGNRVWFDANGNGTRDAGEDIGPLPTGIPVNLYRDSDNDGNPDDINVIGDLTDDILLSTSIDAAGFYRFDNLVAGSYIVEVVPPAGYASTVDAGDPDTDVDDDDDNGVNFVGSNVRSDSVTLGPGGIEPEIEDNPTTNPEATLGEAPDNRSNRTVDFGFIDSAATSEKQLTATTMMDTDPATGNPIAGTDVTTTPRVAIGEILTYVARLRIPSGATLTSLGAADQLDDGLAFVGCDSIIASDPGLTTNLIGGFDAACNNSGTTPPANPLISPRTGGYNDAGRINFSLGDVTNATADTQILAITYRVIVLDIPSNQNGIGGLNNSVIWSWGGGSQLPAQANPVEIVEPDLSIDKRATPSTASLGSNISFTISIAHTAESSMDAFDVMVSDILPTGLQYVAGSLQFAGVTPNVPTLPDDYYDPSTNTLTFNWDVFPLGSTASITFTATFVGPAPVVNSANVLWSSMPIDPQPGGTPVLLSPFNDFSTERWYDPADPTGLNPYGRTASVTITLPVDEGGFEHDGLRLPATGFAPDVVTKLPPMPADFAYAPTSITLEIPKLKQTMNITGVPFDNKEHEWNLTWLNTEAGWLENTAFPTHAGNSALTAHTTLSNGKPGPFAKLSALSYGDQVIIHLDGQKYIFEVRDNKQVKPSEVKSALKHEEYPWLTLITCKSYNEKTGEYAYRTVVRAVLVKVVDE